MRTASKFRHHEVLQQAIATTIWPFSAILKAKCWEDDIDPAWRADRLSIMREIQKIKFLQHPQLYERLLQTGDATLIHCAEDDLILASLPYAWFLRLEQFKADSQVLVHGLIHGTAPPFTLDVIVQADDGHTVKLSGETSYPAKKYDFGDVKQMSTQNIGQKKINFYRARVPLHLCKDEHYSRSIKLKLKWAGPTPSISSDFELQIESSVMIFPGCILWLLRSMYRFGQTSPLQPQAGRLTLSVTSSDNVLSVILAFT
ncbi:hypothetical protein OC844_001469 [Tilletia horrida]|nr:hypothetical protein OC844_001469 [Tilletia horrida]